MGYLLPSGVVEIGRMLCAYQRGDQTAGEQLLQLCSGQIGSVLRTAKKRLATYVDRKDAQSVAAAEALRLAQKFKRQRPFSYRHTGACFLQLLKKALVFRILEVLKQMYVQQSPPDMALSGKRLSERDDEWAGVVDLCDSFSSLARVLSQEQLDIMFMLAYGYTCSAIMQLLQKSEASMSYSLQAIREALAAEIARG